MVFHDFFFQTAEGCGSDRRCSTHTYSVPAALNGEESINAFEMSVSDFIHVSKVDYSL